MRHMSVYNDGVGCCSRVAQLPGDEHRSMVAGPKSKAILWPHNVLLE